MPENSPALAAPAVSTRDRLGVVADALGTSPLRLVLGAVVGVVMAAAVVWTLVAVPSSGGIDDEALPRAAGPSPPSGSGSGSDSGSGSGDPGGTAPRSLVYVTGAVVAPGVYRMPPDARVADALHAAGGAAPDAELSLLNLAAVVADGERVYVPRKGESAPPDVLGSVGALARAGPLNLNTATAEQLEDLPGIGPSTAQAIVAWRRQHGRFRRVDDLINVRGIGPAKLDALRDQVRV